MSSIDSSHWNDITLKADSKWFTTLTHYHDTMTTGNIFSGYFCFIAFEITVFFKSDLHFKSFSEDVIFF